MTTTQTTTQQDYAVFIGRFQPFHIGHLFVFRESLKHAKALIVLVGSSGGARSLRNPFTFAERQEMIRQSLPEDISERVTLLPLQDFTYNDSAWVDSVTALVTDYIAQCQNKPQHLPHVAPRVSSANVALVGHDKDETTYYLKLFPNWAYIEVGNLDGINATAVRQRYFTHDLPTQFNSDILLPTTVDWLCQFGQSEDFIALAHEYHEIERFKSAWANTPYPVIFTTTDALICYRDEILLITRKNYPGKDLLALPGGFLDKDETLFDGCLREVTEETHLNVDTPTLKQSLVKHHVFDNPKRSTRGRVITNCYYFDLSHLPEKPSAQADDDAKALAWYNIADLDRSRFFEDHFFIIQYLLNNV